MNAQLTACLLAGGRSTRMGRDKAGVEFAGEPLWQRQLRTLRQTGADEILISGREDACYRDCGFPVIEDKVRDSGPLAGVAALLSASAHPHVLILAIDMPYLTSDYLAALWRQCSEGKGAIPEKSGFYEGLAAIFPKKAVAIAAGALRGDDHSMQGFVRECEAAGMVKIIKVGKDEEVLFRSLNSAADLAGTPS